MYRNTMASFCYAKSQKKKKKKKKEKESMLLKTMVYRNTMASKL
jgi:hypothetical protein